MSYSRRSRFSSSPSPYRKYERSVSRSLSRSKSLSSSRSRSRSYDSSEVENPGNNLYVTGLSPRVTKRDLEKHFSTEGKVEDVHLVVDPWSRESRGFGFVTMSTVKEADRCIKYLDRSVLEGRVIMVEKARRRRGRTPTPGRYLGLRAEPGRRRSPSYSPYHRSRSSGYSSERGRSRSYSPDYSSRRHGPYPSRRRRSISPYYIRRRRSVSYSRSRSPDRRSPVSRHDYYRNYSPEDCYYRRSRYRSVSRSVSPRKYWYSRRSYSRSISPRPSSRRRYSPSVTPSVSPPRRHRSYSYRRGYSRDSYSSRSPSVSRSVSSFSRSPSP